MAKKFNICLLILFTVVSAVLPVRHGAGHLRKESHLKSGKSPRTRFDIFENLFVVYDPSFLALVWPKIMNGVHVDVDRGCWDDLSVFFKALNEGRAWAYSAVDASGRYQPGIFQGNRFWLGSKDLCFRLDNDFVSSSKQHNLDKGITLRFEKDFNDDLYEWPSFDRKNVRTRSLATTETTPPHRLAYVVVQVILNITKFKPPKSYEISLGLCLPRSCSPDDVASLVNFSVMLNDHLKSNGSIPRSVKITSLRHIEEHYHIKYDTGAVVLVLITLILVTLAIIATILDFGLIKCIKNQSGSLNLDAKKFNNTEIYEDRKPNLELVKVFVGLKKANINNKSNARFNNEMPEVNVDVMKKVANVKEDSSKINLDMVSKERSVASCKRCGKYRRQCGIPRHWDNLPVYPQMNYKPCASLTNTEYRKRDNIFLNLFLSFSLKHNCKRIFNTNMSNRDLAVVHLLRVFATFWVVLIHVSTLVDYLSDNYNGVTGTGDYPVLTSGTLAFDILFFVSGTFSAHHFFYLSGRYTVRELVSCGGYCGKVMQFVCFVTNRAVRLLPPYVYTIFLSAALSRVWRDTAAAVLPEDDYENCDTYWWRNVLYITQFYPRNEQCMQVSWYLSAEGALHACGALLCALAACGARSGAGRAARRGAGALLAAGLLSALACDLVRAFADYHKRFHGIFEGYYFLIERPVGRVAPYLIGLVTGWLVHKADGRTPVSRLTRCCLWLVSACALVTSAVTSLAWPHWSGAWLRLGLPAALLWPVLTSSTDHAASTRRLLSSATLAALTRLCYCALLLHGPVARWLLLSANQELCSNTACLWLYFAGTSLLTVVCALLLSVLLEMPCCCALRRLCDYAYS